MNIMTDTGAIKREIKSINTARAKLVDRIQIAALSVANHAHLHGDITLVNSLAEAVGNGMKATALKLWLLDYCPVVWDEKAKAFIYEKTKRVAGDELPATIEKAALKPWYDYKTEKPVDEFTDVARLLNAILRKVEKAPAKEGQERLLAQVRDLVREAGE